MPLHLGPRWHAFLHGLFRRRDATETRDLYARVHAMFERCGLVGDVAREDLVADLTFGVFAAFDIGPGHRQAEPIEALIGRLLDYEEMFVLPAIDWGDECSASLWMS